MRGVDVDTLSVITRPPRPASGSVWALVVLALVGAGVVWRLADLPDVAPAGPLPLQWWGLLPLVVAAQAGQVHFQVRRHAHSVTLCHLPIVIGLVCCSPGAFVLVRVLGGFLGMAAVRRQRGLKLALNTAAYTLEAVVAVTLLHALATWPDPGRALRGDAARRPHQPARRGHRDQPVRAPSGGVALVRPGAVAAAGERRGDQRRAARRRVALAGRSATCRCSRGSPRRCCWPTAPMRGCATGTSTSGGCRTSRSRCPALVPGAPELAAAVEQVRVLLVAEQAELWLADGRVVRAAHEREAVCAAGRWRAPGGAGPGLPHRPGGLRAGPVQRHAAGAGAAGSGPRLRPGRRAAAAGARGTAQRRPRARRRPAAAARRGPP